MAAYSRLVISTTSPKEAALYFPYVVPISTVGETFKSVSNRKDGSPDWLYKEDLSALLPPKFKDDAKFKRQLSKINVSIGYHARFPTKEAIIEARERIASRYGKKLAPDGVFFGDDLRKQVRIFLRKYGLQNSVADGPLPVVGRVEEVADDDFVLALRDAALIDVDKVNWDQLLEFRKDRVAQERLRSFRLFAFENYGDKGRSFIEDDVSRRFDEYRQTVKSWGFDTGAGIVNSVLSSKSLGGALSGSLAAVLVGGSIPVAAPAAAAVASIAATVGVSAEIGKIAVQIVRRRSEFRQMLRDNPFSYLGYATDKLTVVDTPAQQLLP